MYLIAVFIAYVYTYIDAKSFDVYSIFKSKSIASKLIIITGDDIEEVFKCYVRDFVMYSCGSSEYNEDTKVLCSEYKCHKIVLCIVSIR